MREFISSDIDDGSKLEVWCAGQLLGEIVGAQAVEYTLPEGCTMSDVTVRRVPPDWGGFTVSVGGPPA